MSKSKNKKIYDSKPPFLILLTGICIAFFIKFFVFDILRIQGTSMEPKFSDGKFVLLNKLAYGLCKPFGGSLIFSWERPKEDDVVIYLYQDHYVIKRCVATEGAPLEYSTERGYTLLVGEKLIPLTEKQFHLIKNSNAVPEGTILAIGDNYNSSVDSRDYGFIPVKNVIGKILCK